MHIEKNRVVSFNYMLREGETELERSDENEPMMFLFGHGGVLSGLEEAMEGKQAGDRFTVTLLPEQAYGYRRADALQRIPIKKLATRKKLRPGDIVAVNTNQGPREVTVVKAGKFVVDVDTNHPLAGRTLTFEIDITEVRSATADEISHGHAHGPGAHQH